MNLKLARLFTIVGLLALIGTAAASADESSLAMRARLSGFNESPPKATLGSGTLKATFKPNASGGVISYTLTYSGLTTPAFMAHFHFGQPAVNGGIFIWLCGNPTDPNAPPVPAGTPPCPPGNTSQTVTVTGDIEADDISAVPGQNVSPGDMATALKIIEAGDAYVNVHSDKFPAGEIRGQVSPGESD